MATRILPVMPAVSPPPVAEGRLYRMPLAVYRRAAEAGVLTGGDRVVLLDGLLVSKMTKGARHEAAKLLTLEALRGLGLRGWHARSESPLGLPGGAGGGYDSEPEPDVTLVRGGVRDYADHHPGPGDVALVVEVADSSLREDRAGLARYARASVPYVWLVNLADGVVEVYGGPSGPSGVYNEHRAYRPGEPIPVVVGGREVGAVDAGGLLP